MIKKLIREALTEAAVEVEMLDKTTFIIHKDDDLCKFALMIDGEVIAYCFSIHVENSDCYSINNIVADKNYGPTMYELTMMALYPSGICPDVSYGTTDKAMNIWNRFMERNDIEKSPIPEEALKDFELEEVTEINKTMFRKEPSSYFNSIVKKSDEFLENYSKEYQMSLSVAKQNFFKRGNRKFQDAYVETF